MSFTDTNPEAALRCFLTPPDRLSCGTAQNVSAQGRCAESLRTSQVLGDALRNLPQPLEPGPRARFGPALL